MFAGAGLPLAALGAASGYLGTPDYSSSFGDYANAIDALGQKYNPYIKGGAMAEKGLGALGGYMMANPAGLENRLAASYQQSPYQTQQLNNLQNQMNTNAAQTGMLGSTAQQAALQNALAGQQNQWMQQYINRGTQQFGQGYGGLQNVGMLAANQGFNALGAQTQLGQEAALGRLKGSLAPTAFQNSMTGAIGMGMMPYYAHGEK